MNLRFEMEFEYNLGTKVSLLFFFIFRNLSKRTGICPLKMRMLNYGRYKCTLLDIVHN